MKKLILMFSLLGFFMFSACGDKPKPEKEEVPTMEEVLAEATDPNDFTVNPLVGQLVSMDMAVKGETTALTTDAASKMAKDGGLLLVKSGNDLYFVFDKDNFAYQAEKLAGFAGKSVALYGMTKQENGMNFFIAEKIEAAQ